MERACAGRAGEHRPLRKSPALSGRKSERQSSAASTLLMNS